MVAGTKVSLMIMMMMKIQVLAMTGNQLLYPKMQVSGLKTESVAI